ncbi:hypothetical protein [Candidatus Chlorohelix sp.]|uniref:hypothetical protein n=1 Tax=Candidatus Chlorohelix sp. TaxID=3139201 RepID=UPI00305B8719
MNKNSVAQNVVQRLRHYNHEIANYLLTASLTLELCGSVRNMTPEDFDLLKVELLKIMGELQKSQDDMKLLSGILQTDSSTNMPILLLENEVA